jgi:hypothetical protein
MLVKNTIPLQNYDDASLLYLSKPIRMNLFFFQIVGFIAWSSATPCDEAPLPALATISLIRGWIAERGKTLTDVEKALGILDITIIPSLNEDIPDPDKIMAGSAYCIPYIS